MRMVPRWFAVFALLAACPAYAQDTLPAEIREGIDRAATEVLEATGAPSASIAIVRDGRIVYVHAYGRARLDPEPAALSGER